MTVLDILGVWNLFMTRRFVPVYTTVYTVPETASPVLKRQTDGQTLPHHNMADFRQAYKKWSKSNATDMLHVSINIFFTESL